MEELQAKGLKFKVRVGQHAKLVYGPSSRGTGLWL
jgi:hypothetical protein